MKQFLIFCCQGLDIFQGFFILFIVRDVSRFLFTTASHPLRHLLSSSKKKLIIKKNGVTSTQASTFLQLRGSGACPINLQDYQKLLQLKRCCSLGKLAKQIFGKSWDFGPTGLTPHPPPPRTLGFPKRKKKSNVYFAF